MELHLEDHRCRERLNIDAWHSAGSITACIHNAHTHIFPPVLVELVEEVNPRRLEIALCPFTALGNVDDEKTNVWSISDQYQQLLQRPLNNVIWQETSDLHRVQLVSGAAVASRKWQVASDRHRIHPTGTFCEPSERCKPSRRMQSQGGEGR